MTVTNEVISVQDVRNYCESCKRTVAPPTFARNMESAGLRVKDDDPTYVFDPAVRYGAGMNEVMRSAYYSDCIAHMGLGLATEYMEYAVIDDPPEEEQGDLCWYAFNLASLVGIENSEMLRAIDLGSSKDSARSIGVAVEAACNQVKRFSFYGLTDRESISRLRGAVLALLSSLAAEIGRHNLKSIWNQNTEKLLGHAGRYSGRRFTVEGARNRADKQ